MVAIDRPIDKLPHGKWQFPNDLTIWHDQIEGYSIDGCAALSEANLVFIFRREVGDGPVIKLVRFYRDEKKQFSGEVLGNIKEISYIIGVNNESSLWVTSVGDVFYLGKSSDLSDFESPIPGRKEQFGYRVISGLDRIGDNVYASGAWRHVFKRIGKNEWVNIAENIDRSDIIDKKGKGWNDKKSSRTGFNCVGGVSENDLYAAGDGGDCWHYNGKDWKRIDLPINSAIFKILAVSTEQVYMACEDGKLLVGSKDKWTVIKYPKNYDNFYQMVYFKNTIYVSTQYQMFKLVSSKLEECSPSMQNVDIALFCFHYLSANDDIMLMCGQVSAALFDGENWFPLVPGD